MHFTHLEEKVAVLELFQKMLIHQVDHKHWERSDVDQRPVCGAERHVPDPPVAQIHLPFTLKVNVAVLELFQKMLIHQVIHKHWERSDSDQRPLGEAERHGPVSPVAQIDWLLTFKETLQF